MLRLFPISRRNAWRSTNEEPAEDERDKENKMLEGIPLNARNNTYWSWKVFWANKLVEVKDFDQIFW